MHDNSGEKLAWHSPSNAAVPSWWGWSSGAEVKRLRGFHPGPSVCYELCRVHG